MRLLISDPATGFELKLPLSARLCASIAERVSRLKGDADRRLFADRLSALVLSSIDPCADLDLRPPSAEDVQDAEDISRRLDILVPPQVLRFRYAMHDFLEVQIPDLLMDRIRKTGEAERSYSELLEGLRIRKITRG